MRACGLSQRKHEYLVALARAFHPAHSDFPLSDESLEAMDDTAVMSALVALRGVGPWSVHMFQMFYLNRPDVLPTKDFGVRKGVMRLYGLRDMPSEAKVEEIAEQWRPHRTLASMYMWQAADGVSPPGRCRAATGGKGRKERRRRRRITGRGRKRRRRGDSGRDVVLVLVHQPRLVVNFIFTGYPLDESGAIATCSTRVVEHTARDVRRDVAFRRANRGDRSVRDLEKANGSPRGRRRGRWAARFPR